MTEKAKNSDSEKKPKVVQPSVIFTLGQMFKWQFITAAFIKAISDVLQFTQPLLLSMLLDFVNDEHGHLWRGIGIALLMLITSEVRSMLVNYYFYVSTTFGLTSIQAADNFSSCFDADPKYKWL